MADSSSTQDALKPWDRERGEPNKWFARFEVYLKLGTDRSLGAAYNAVRAAKTVEIATVDDIENENGAISARKRASGVPQSWRNAAEKWNWEKRAEAWDAFDREETNKKWEQEREKKRQDWEARCEKLRDREYKISQMSLDKAEEMLMFPVGKPVREEIVGADGQVMVVTTINPVGFKFGDAGKLLEAGSKVGRLSTGMVTNIEEHREKPAEEMSDEELAAIAAQGRAARTSEGDAGGSGTGTTETAASA